jgi:hypothetical protein
VILMSSRSIERAVVPEVARMCVPTAKPVLFHWRFALPFASAVTVLDEVSPTVTKIVAPAGQFWRPM